MQPAVQRGMEKSGRSRVHFDVAMKPLVACARTEEDLQPKIWDARARIAFYASTPAYQEAFAFHGLEKLASEAKNLSKAQQWEKLPDMIDDEVLNTFVTIGTYDTIGSRLLDRYADVGGIGIELERRRSDA